MPEPPDTFDPDSDDGEEEEEEEEEEEKEEKPKYLDNSSQASDPLGVRLSRPRLYQAMELPWGLMWFLRLVPGLRHFRQLEEMIGEYLYHGDSRAALVVSLHPVLVAAYTDELDCVALLEFPVEFLERFQLKLDQRLVSVNVYYRGDDVAPDLIPGPHDTGRWINFEPLIANFLTKELDKVRDRQESISQSEWERCAAAAQEALAAGIRPRSGQPLSSGDPAGESAEESGER